MGETSYYVVATIGTYGVDVIAGPFGDRERAAEVCRRHHEAPARPPAGSPPSAPTYEVVSNAELWRAGTRGRVCRW